MIFEVVADSLAEVKAADNYNVKRIEICSALQVGGLTPSYAFTEMAVSMVDCEIHQMIRPRSGGFNYTDTEIEIMKRDIEIAASLGCKGVVFGVLNDGGDLDLKNIELLYKIAKKHNLEATFHRALDSTKDINASIEALISVGFDRLLTSGGAVDVEQGLESLQNMNANYGSEIQIMAGGGVNFENYIKLKAAGLKAVHFNIKTINDYSSSKLMGEEYSVDLDKISLITNY